MSPHRSAALVVAISADGTGDAHVSGPAWALGWGVADAKRSRDSNDAADALAGYG